MDTSNQPSPYEDHVWGLIIDTGGSKYVLFTRMSGGNWPSVHVMVQPLKNSELWAVTKVELKGFFKKSIHITICRPTTFRSDMPWKAFPTIRRDVVLNDSFFDMTDGGGCSNALVCIRERTKEERAPNDWWEPLHRDKLQVLLERLVEAKRM